MTGPTCENFEQERIELESRVLIAAFKQGVDLGDPYAANFAHKQLFRLLRLREVSRVDAHPKPKGEPTAELPKVICTVEEPLHLLPSISPFKPGRSPALPSKPNDAGWLSAKLMKVINESASKPISFKAPVSDGKFEKLLEQVSKAADAYEVLDVPREAGASSIHRNFLKQIKLVLQQPGGNKSKESLGRLRAMWIAHDILMDERTRNNYDCEVLGLEGKHVEVPTSSGFRKPELSTRLGELLEVAGLIEEADLHIAFDMHKAMPEMHLGAFLAQQGYLEEFQLQAVLEAQWLIRKGKLQIDQFKEAMEILNQSRGNFKNILMEKKFCSRADIDQLETLGPTITNITSDFWPKVDPNKVGQSKGK